MLACSRGNRGICFRTPAEELMKAQMRFYMLNCEKIELQKQQNAEDMETGWIKRRLMEKMISSMEAKDTSDVEGFPFHQFNVQFIIIIFISKLKPQNIKSDFIIFVWQYWGGHLVV